MIKYLQKNLSSFVYGGIGILLIAIAIKFGRWNDRIITYDTVHYYGYLPATFIYNDLSLNFTDTNEKYFANKIWYNTTSDGKRVFKVGMGMSICYLPFFLTAHGFSLLSGVEALGFSTPYKAALVWSSLVFVLIGLYYLRKILKIWFGELIVSTVLVLTIFGTNLFNYVTYEGTMSHAYSFAILTIFLWNTIQWNKHPSYSRSIIIGLLIGWIFLIRPVNLLVILIFIGWGMYDLNTIRNKISLLCKQWKQLILIAIFAFLVCIPQLLYWKFYSGNWIFYSYVGEQFYFMHPYILEGLFSWRKGWLLYTPVMILAITGMFFMMKKIKEAVFIYPLSLILILYITFSWWCWWYGGGAGQRSLIDWYGWMAIPIACLLETVRSKRIIFSFVMLFVIFCCILNQFQHLQYRSMSIHYDSMTRKAYFYHFWSINKHPGVDAYFIAPDYEKARKGEREYYWE